MPNAPRKKSQKAGAGQPASAKGFEAAASFAPELTAEAERAVNGHAIASPEGEAPDAAAVPEWQREFFVQHRLSSARIPRRFAGKTLDNFRGKDVMRRRLLAEAREFVHKFSFKDHFPSGLLMIGPVGSGKSHLAASILREVVAKGYSGLFYNSPDLLRDIRATFNNEPGGISEDELLEEITMVDLLVLDDVGAEKISEFVLDRFYLIVNKRYEECKPLIVTTNLDEETLRNRLGERVVSRLYEMCSPFPPFPEEDFRRKMMQG
jgi:DNA replication protein DnaC